MKIVRHISALIITSALFGGVLSAEGNKTTAEQTKLTGIVSDSMCGAKHMAKDKSAANCTRECVKSGSDYALVVKDKVYTLQGDKAQIDKLAGERATVKGKVSGNTVTVESIAAASQQ